MSTFVSSQWQVVDSLISSAVIIAHISELAEERWEQTAKSTRPVTGYHNSVKVLLENDKTWYVTWSQSFIFVITGSCASFNAKAIVEKSTFTPVKSYRRPLNGESVGSLRTRLPWGSRRANFSYGPLRSLWKTARGTKVATLSYI